MAQGENCVPGQASPVLTPQLVAPTVLPVATGSFAQRYAGPGALLLTNRSQVVICDVNMAPSTDREWGDDWLAADEMIAPGATRRFAISGGAPWDVRVGNCDHHVFAVTQRTRISPASSSMSVVRGNAAYPVVIAILGGVAAALGVYLIIIPDGETATIGGWAFAILGVACLIGGIIGAAVPFWGIQVTDSRVARRPSGFALLGIGVAPAEHGGIVAGTGIRFCAGGITDVVASVNAHPAPARSATSCPHAAPISLPPLYLRTTGTPSRASAS